MYIDENGDLCGTNDDLKRAMSLEKTEGDSEAMEQCRLPENCLEELLRRLVSDENITPNISHMGYDGERFFTDDGEFNFGKENDLNLLNDTKYAVRGVMSSYFFQPYGRWLDFENKEML